MATNNANSDIEILVGVQGGESISDGSGQLISATLKKIASHISQQQLIKVTVGADLRTSKNSIQKTLNQADIKIHNIGFGENVSSKLQGQLAKMGFSIDIDANLKEAEKKEQTSDKKTGSGGTRIRKPKDIDYLSQNEKTADKFTRTLSRISSKNGEIVMSAERVAKAYAEAEDAVNELASSSEKYDAAAIGHIEGLIDRLKISVSDEIQAQKKALKEASGSSGTAITAKNSQNQTIVDSQLKKLDNAIVNSGAVAQTDAVQQKYAELRAEIQRCADSAVAYGHEQEIALKRAVAGISDVIAEQRKIAKNESAESMNKALVDSQAALSSFNQYLKTLNPKVFSEYASDIGKINRLLKEQTPDAFKQAQSAIKSFKAQMKDAGYEGGNVFTFLEGKIKTFATYLVSSTLTMGAVNTFNNVVNSVKTLDTALTDLRIVTNGTVDDTKKLLKTYNDLAQELGSTTADVAAGATDWLRQGYNEAESRELLKQSTLLSIVGDMDAAASTTALTSALKGYELQIDDVAGVVDKFFAVDMKAATSAEKLSLALAKTAANAKIAGLSLDDVIGQLAVVNETMAEEGESSGTFYNTMLSRMSAIKAGRLTDYESGDDVSDVETVLRGLGIELRTAEGDFRNFGEVLDEVGASWDSYSNISQRAIASAFAGTRQQTRFLTLMEGWDRAAQYSEAAANSTGLAAEKLGIYQESLEAKQAKLTAAFEAFSQTFLNSDIIALVLDLGTGFLNLAANMNPAAIEFAEITAAVIAGATAFNMLKTSSLGTGFHKTFEDLGWPKKTGDIVPIYSKKTA